MSSEDGEVFQDTKRRRLTRACDGCRRRKVKCDGTGYQSCSTCTLGNIQCTYLLDAPKRPPRYKEVVLCARCRNPASNTLLQTGEDDARARLLKMRTLLRKFMSDEGIDKEMNGPESFGSLESSVHSPESTLGTSLEPTDNGVDEIEEALSAMSFSDGAYLGKSSAASLYLQAAVYKQTAPGGAPPFPLNPPIEYPWETALANNTVQQPFVFPPEDLLYALVDIYFDRWNIFIPLLHRPTFMKQLFSGLHHENRLFGANLLVICAAASRFSDDPRVYLQEFGSNPMTCGWKWLNQIQFLRHSALKTPQGSELFELQFYVLFLMTLAGGTGHLQMVWVILGIGVRFGQHVGADRKKSGPLTIEDELMKRAWWALVISDKILASNLGRPSAVREEEFNQDLPLDCDDEYWGDLNPDQMLKQPADKPSKLNCFIQTIELARIMGVALRTLYISSSTERKSPEELDSALNRWDQNLPDHLRWDPHRVDDAFFFQSAYLRIFHNMLQILVHRPFISLPGKGQKFATTSLLICASTARSSVHTLEAVAARGSIDYNWFQGGAFTAAMILSLSIMARTREGNTTNIKRDTDDVQSCINMLTACSKGWRFAARLLDSLTDLASPGDAVTGEKASRGHKRDRLFAELGPNPIPDMAPSTSQYHTNGSTTVSPPRNQPSGSFGFLPPLMPERSAAPAFDISHSLFDFTSLFSADYGTSQNNDMNFWPSIPTNLFSADDWNNFMNELQFQSSEAPSSADTNISESNVYKSNVSHQ